MPLKRSPQEITRILEESRTTPLTKTEFCNERNIPIQTYYSWLKKEARFKQKKINFLPVCIEKARLEICSLPQAEKEKISLKLRSGIEVEFPLSISSGFFSSLLKELL